MLFPVQEILLLIPALDYNPFTDPFPDLINPALAVLSSGFLILVRQLLSGGRARTTALLPLTINLAEATALLLPVVPQRYDGDLARKLPRILDSWSWLYSTADALPDIFALAAFFGSNNKLDPSQIVDFLKWIMTHNHTVNFTLFMAIQIPTVNAFATVAVQSAIRAKSVQALEILFDCGVKLDDMLNRVALLDGAGNLTQCVLSGMSLASLAATGVGANLFHHFVSERQYDLALSLLQKGVGVEDLREHDDRSALYQAVMKKDVEGTKFLLAAGADVHRDDATTHISPFACAVVCNDAELVDLFLGRGADISSKVGDMTILEWAARHSSTMFKLLKDRLGLGATEDPGAGGFSLAGVFDPPGRSNPALAGAHVPGGLGQGTARQLEKDLEESIRGNDLTAAMTLLQNGASPDGPTLHAPPLKAAMQSDVIGHGFVQLLLEHGADPNREGLLETVVGTGRSDLLEMFLARPTDLEQRMKALVVAARAGNIASAAMLIKTPGMDIDTPGLLLNPLQAAAGTGMDRGVSMVLFLLGKGANVNAPAHPNRGRTALQAALEFAPTFEIAETLLRYGADAAAPPAEGHGVTALEALCDNPYARGNPRLIDMLLAASATVNRPGEEPSSVLHGVVKNGMHAILSRFLEPTHHVSLNHMWRDKADRKRGAHTPAQLAASLGDLEALRILLKHGAYVNQPPDRQFGRTALQGAADLRRLGPDKMALVRFLLDCGADVNAAPAAEGGFTALQGAARAGDLFLVSFLLDRGANVNAAPADRGGITALQVAARTGNILLAELLIARGAHVNARPAFELGGTTVEMAAEHGRLDMVQLLLNAGATGSRTREGHGLDQAIRLAEKAGHSAIADILKTEQARQETRALSRA